MTFSLPEEPLFRTFGEEMLKGSLINEMEASHKRALGGISSPFWKLPGFSTVHHQK
jgi:hypothetical protein